MTKIVASLLQPLNEIVQEVMDKQDPNNTEEGRLPPISQRQLEDTQDFLDLIADLFKEFDDFPKMLTSEQQNPVLGLFGELWPFVEKMIDNFVLVDGVIESLFRLIKMLMRSVGAQFLPYLEPLLKKALWGFEKNPIGTFIYSVEFTLTEFGGNPQHEFVFVQAFDFICMNSGQVLATAENCKRSPHLVNDFFGLSKRILRYNEDVFFKSTQL